MTPTVSPHADVIARLLKGLAHLKADQRPGAGEWATALLACFLEHSQRYGHTSDSLRAWLNDRVACWPGWERASDAPIHETVQ